MKTITINVSDPVYKEFTHFAKQRGRPTSELIRSAMEEYFQRHMVRQTSLRNRRPTTAGGPLHPLTGEDDLLGEMLHDPRD